MSLSVPFLSNLPALYAPDVFLGPAPSGFLRLAHQRDPWRVIWAVRADGVLCGMTYRRDQDVWAWHRHPRSGRVRDIAVIPHQDGQADELWLLIERNVNGTVKRFIEVMELPHKPADTQDVANYLFLDSTLTYRGDPASTISGLDHLEGETVGLLADGVALTERTVSGGAVTLESPASLVHVGLPYRAVLKILPLDRGGGDGTGASRPKAIAEARILVRHTIGGAAGRSEEALDPLLDRTVEDVMDAPPRLTDGYRSVALNTGWDADGQFLIVQDQPYPMTILAVVPVTTLPGR